MIGRNEERGWTSAGEERGGCSSWRAGRIQENKANLHLSPCLVFHAQVNTEFLSMRVMPHPGEQMGRWKQFFSLCYPLQPDSYFQYQITMGIVIWYWKLTGYKIPVGM